MLAFGVHVSIFDGLTNILENEPFSSTSLYIARSFFSAVIVWQLLGHAALSPNFILFLRHSLLCRYLITAVFLLYKIILKSWKTNGLPYCHEASDKNAGKVLNHQNNPQFVTIFWETCWYYGCLLIMELGNWCTRYSTSCVQVIHRGMEEVRGWRCKIREVEHTDMRCTGEEGSERVTSATTECFSTLYQKVESQTGTLSPRHQKTKSSALFIKHL